MENNTNNKCKPMLACFLAASKINSGDGYDIEYNTPGVNTPPRRMADIRNLFAKRFTTSVIARSEQYMRERIIKSELLFHEISRELVKARVPMPLVNLSNSFVYVLGENYCLPLAICNDSGAVVVQRGEYLAPEDFEAIAVTIDSLLLEKGKKAPLCWVNLSFRINKGKRIYKTQVILPSAYNEKQRMMFRQKVIGRLLAADATWIKAELQALESRSLGREERRNLLLNMEKNGLTRIETPLAVIRIRRRGQSVSVRVADLKEHYPKIFEELAVKRSGRVSISITRKKVKEKNNGTSAD